MTDVFTPAKRSEVMSRIRGKNTKPEVAFRKIMFALGYRYRLNDRSLLGSPDIVLRSRKIALFVHGCFWHGHKDCPDYRPPKSNTEFWVEKIEGNKARDAKIEAKLLNEGWRIGVIWECALEGSVNIESTGKIINAWIKSEQSTRIEVRRSLNSKKPKVT